jgi:hypothetical protein
MFLKFEYIVIQDYSDTNSHLGKKLEIYSNLLLLSRN